MRQLKTVQGTKEYIILAGSLCAPEDGSTNMTVNASMVPGRLCKMQENFNFGDSETMDTAPLTPFNKFVVTLSPPRQPSGRPIAL
jgi:hypothetical protein